MALTMTRNRTQTTLTKLAERVASVHGELAYVEGRLAEGAQEMPEELREGLARRRAELLVVREALYVTLRQFDPALDPTAIGATEEWLRPYGRGKAAERRYTTAMKSPKVAVSSASSTRLLSLGWLSSPERGAR